MATRQYIGARYVPKFFEDGQGGNSWLPNVAYEPLTVVTYLNNSYTSKIPVPSSNVAPNLDTEHWVLTGAYNAQIDAYRQEVAELSETVDGIGETVSGLSDSVDGLGTRVTANEEAIDELEQRIVGSGDVRLRRNYLLIADSYGMNPRAQRTWTTNFVNKVANSRQKSESGYGFLTGDDTRFLSLLEAFNTELTEEERNAVTDIIVCGGWNDARQIQGYGKTTDDLSAAIEDFVDYAELHFPNAIVWIGGISYQTSSIVQEGVTFSSLMTALDVYNSIRYKKLRTLENVQFVLRQTELLDETFFHPNTAGGDALFSAIYNAVNGGFSCHASKKTLMSQCINIPSGVTLGLTNQLLCCSVDNNISRVKCSSLIPISAFTPTSVFSKLFDFKEYILPYSYTNIQVLNSFFTGTIGGNAVNIPLYIQIDSSRNVNIFVPTQYQNVVWVGNIIIDWTIDNTLEF